MTATMMAKLSKAAALLLLLAACHANPDQRSVVVLNQSGHRINLYWINRWNHDELVLNNAEGPVLFGADISINSYATHEFEVQELPHKKTNKCGGPNEECRTVQFQVNDNEGQIITIKKGFEVDHVDNKSKARDQAKELLEQCKAKTVTSSEESSPQDTLDNLFECVNDGLQDSLDKTQEEIDYQAGIRTKLGSHLASYACADESLNTTDSIRNETYTLNNKRYKVRVLHDRPTSKIHYIEDFITENECRIIREEDWSVLNDVHEDDGLIGKRGILPVTKKPQLAAIQRKAVDYASEFLEVELGEYPQEDLVSIYYSGQGLPDQYHKHCAGKCDGGTHESGERVASVIFYCQTADKGGSTIFHNSGIYIKPKKGGAVFVSYVNPDTSQVDTGFTQLAGCPVREGVKRVVTQHIRMGEEAEQK